MFQVLKLSLVAAGATLITAAAGAQGPVEAHPELRPRAILISILSALETTIADPRSVNDLVLCPATRVKYERDGRPRSWYVAFSMNARTADGGYAGQKMYGAMFKAGRPTKVYRTQAPTDEGFDHLINAELRKQMRDCPRVSNEQLTELLGASNRPAVDVSQ